jgi:hypothetical protein
VYRLADYLEQHCRRTRRGCIPPKSFWNATLSHASPGDLPALAAAENRGLLLEAARLRKHAAERGSTREAASSSRTCMPCACPTPGQRSGPPTVPPSTTQAPSRPSCAPCRRQAQTNRSPL